MTKLVLPCDIAALHLPMVASLVGAVHISETTSAQLQLLTAGSVTQLEWLIYAAFWE